MASPEPGKLRTPSARRRLGLRGAAKRASCSSQDFPSARIPGARTGRTRNVADLLASVGAYGGRRDKHGTGASPPGRAAGAGPTFVVSDLYDTEGFHAGLRLLRGSGREVVVIHVLTRAELAPPQEGAFEWRDVETGAELEVTLDPATLALYDAALRDWLASIRSICARLAVRYVLAVSDEPLTTCSSSRCARKVYCADAAPHAA